MQSTPCVCGRRGYAVVVRSVFRETGTASSHIAPPTICMQVIYYSKGLVAVRTITNSFDDNANM